MARHTSRPSHGLWLGSHAPRTQASASLCARTWMGCWHPWPGASRSSAMGASRTSPLWFVRSTTWAWRTRPEPSSSARRMQRSRPAPRLGPRGFVALLVLEMQTSSLALGVDSPLRAAMAFHMTVRGRLPFSMPQPFELWRRGTQISQRLRWTAWATARTRCLSTCGGGWGGSREEVPPTRPETAYPREAIAATSSRWHSS
mmetsp:Transcript_69874/g.227420  ORF Transcript_69874/g.227420 Transcript_69874/m.227420 type:complete len:201 (-) Transcript_69874:782-1384(-)